MGVPPEMDVYFESVDGAALAHARYRADPRPGILLTGTVDAMARFVSAARAADPAGAPRTVNLGGLHHRPGRVPRMRYVFLDADEERALRALAADGLAVTAQDVPNARPVPLADVLSGRADD
jgi:PTS system mannose-specific IIB component/fructoselysine and glucoselysine-specific PTS system IIB component